MADLTRRGFLAQMSITTGVGIAGGLGLQHVLTSQPESNAVSAVPMAAVPPASPVDVAAAEVVSLDRVSLAGPMMVHVRDVPTGEIALMIGTQELVYRDPELVSRLVEKASSATRAEA
jgi:hypothetical protein